MSNRSVYGQCLEKVRQEIEGLNLYGLDPSEKPVVRKHPGDNNKLRKGITISPGNPVEGRGTNASDDIGYPVSVTILKAGNGSLLDHIDRQMFWKEEIRKHFSRRRLTGLTIKGGSFLECVVRDGEAFDPKLFENATDASTLLILCWTREPRAS